MNNRIKSANSIALIAAFFAIYFIWGTTYLASIIGLESIKPFVLSALRYLSAAMILVAYLIASKKFKLERSSLPVLAISGTLMLVGGSGLVVYGEQYVNSGYAAVIIATEPLWFILLDKKRWRLYFGNKGVIIGLLMGFVGIAIFAWLSPTEVVLRPGGLLTGTFIILISAVLWVLGTLYANKNLPVKGSTISYTAVQLMSGGLSSAVVAFILGEWSSFNPATVTTRVWLSLVFLVVFGSLIAYVAFNWLLTVRAPAVVSTHTYVNPVVAVLIGWAFADEHISGQQMMALCIVLIAVIVTQLSKQKALNKEEVHHVEKVEELVV